MTGPANTFLRTLTAIGSIGAGVLHWDIWANHGYRNTPVREMFIASAVAGVAVGLLALLPKRGAALPAVVANAAFLVAFALSRVTTLPTFHGPFSERGLAPTDAMIGGVSTTLLLLIAEGAAVVLGLGSLLFGRAARSRALPAEFARA